ncbi:methyl-accepting chemotaxis protein [Ferrimonas pelagia]|uniref:Methyl-accepting chemotaxis protein n=1 Tax=Ferrimonas pelagia TaxID=1177826 RepID=A0ABP9FCY0_9GAMM
MSVIFRPLAALTLIQRITLSMLLQLAIALALVGCALWGLTTLSRTIDQLGTEALPIATAAGSIERQVLQLDQSLRNAINSGDLAQFHQRQQIYQQHQQQLRTALAQLQHASERYPHPWLVQGLEPITLQTRDTQQTMDTLLRQIAQKLEIEHTLSEGRGYLLFSVNSVRNEMARIYPLLFDTLPGANDAYDSFISGAGGLVGAIVQLTTANTPDEAQNQYREVRAYISRMRFQYDSLAQLNPELDTFPSALAALEVLEQGATRDGLFAQEVERVRLNHLTENGLSQLLSQLQPLAEALALLRANADQLVAQAQTDTTETVQQSRKWLLALTLLGGLIVAYLTYRLMLRLRHVLAQLKGTIKAMANGDFTHYCHANSPAEFQQLARWLNQANDNNRDTMGQLRQRGQELSQAAEVSTQISHNQQQALATQASQTTQIAAAVAELDASLQGIAQASAQTSEDSRLSADLAKQGQQALYRTSEHLDALASHLNDNDGRMAELDTQVDQIGAVAEVINNIADRTNLLALNAAIEAARAGEQGRGFAVVADEVRKLAAQTREQTNSIEQMIQTLHHAAGNARHSITASREEMSRTAELRQTLEGATEQIHHAIVMVQSRADAITSATAEQTEQCHQINTSVRSLAAQASERQNQIDQLSVQSEQVAHIADEQRQKLEQFVV